MLLLCVDMLGIKTRWRDQGLAGALAGFELFDEVVHSGLRAVPDPGLVWGGIDSDAAAPVFEIPEHAFNAADAMFNAAFAKPRQL